MLGFFIFPVVRALYRRFFTRFSHWVLGTQPAADVPVRRFVLALNDGGPFNIRIGANVNPEQPAEAQQPNAPRPPDAAAAAEQTIRVSGASLGRLIGGALIIPVVSNRMGALLFHLSKHSLVLRRFLAVRPPLGGLPAPPMMLRYSLAYNRQWQEMSRLKQIATAVRLAFSAVWGGTRIWAECDPVWWVFPGLPVKKWFIMYALFSSTCRWRNSIGLGLFVVVRHTLARYQALVNISLPRLKTAFNCSIFGSQNVNWKADA
jgi:hypothetical protein